MTVVVAGDVFLIYCRLINPPKDKFVVCVCPQRRWFFFINSEPWKPPETQIRLTTNDLDFLAHESWLDTSRISCMTEVELNEALGEPGRSKGTLGESVRAKLVNAIENSMTLPKGQIDILLANLNIKETR